MQIERINFKIHTRSWILIDWNMNRPYEIIHVSRKIFEYLGLDTLFYFERIVTGFFRNISDLVSRHDKEETYIIYFDIQKRCDISRIICHRRACFVLCSRVQAAILQSESAINLMSTAFSETTYTFAVNACPLHPNLLFFPYR